MSRGNASPRRGLAWGGLAVLLLLLMLASLSVGGGVGPWRSVELLMRSIAGAQDATWHHALFALRLPRTTAALVVGTLLGSAGWLLQAVTRNPLAETGILGINAGAAMAVVLTLTFFGTSTAIGTMAAGFIGALAACSLVLGLARVGGIATPMRLVLAGAALAATLHGLTAILLVTHRLGYDDYRFWIQGALSGVSAPATWVALPLALATLAGAAALVRPVTALALGDSTARSLGYRPGPIRLGVVILVALASGLAVALAGPIAFVGLLAPHAARWIVPEASLDQWAAAVLFGAVIVLVADMLARSIIAPYEAPLSALIAVLGAPVMIAIVRGRRLAHVSGGGL